jgi:hypothetical protein
MVIPVHDQQLFHFVAGNRTRARHPIDIYRGRQWIVQPCGSGSELRDIMSVPTCRIGIDPRSRRQFRGSFFGHVMGEVTRSQWAKPDQFCKPSEKKQIIVLNAVV